MVRNILAGIIGLVVGWIVITVMQLIMYLIWPIGQIDYNDAASFSRMIASMTTIQFVFLLFGYAVGSFCSGAVIGKIAEAKGNLIPVIVGAFLTGAWVMLNLSYPHPTWVIVAGLFMYIPFTILGKHLTAGSGTVAAEGGISDEVAESEAGISMDDGAGEADGDPE